MKKLIGLALAGLMFSGIAMAADAELCSTEIRYVIKDSNGNIMDDTKYTRLWPLDCVTQVQGKYLMLQAVFGQGEARFKQLSGE